MEECEELLQYTREKLCTVDGGCGWIFVSGRGRAISQLGGKMHGKWKMEKKKGRRELCIK